MFAHLALPKNKTKELQEFREQQEFRYANTPGWGCSPKKVEYEPVLKNMYKIRQEYNWDYAEASHSYAIG